MDYYLDIKLLPDPEFSAAVLMGALYSKLHRALVSLEEDSIGISFPQYQLRPKSLGEMLRIHGGHAALTRLQATDWIKGMRDYTDITAIQSVPANAGHQLVKRRQYKTSADRLRRRRMTRKGETYEQATLAIPDTVERKADLPFLTLRSSSTGQTFSLFIEQQGMSLPSDGKFNFYGLSQQATVPVF